MTIVEFLAYVKEAGVLIAPVLAVLYWLERDERKDAQKELRDVSEKSITAMIELKAMISQLSVIFGARNKE
jgi:hypothetical protein